MKFRECSRNLCKLAAGTYQLRNTSLGIWLSRVGGETVLSLLVKAAKLRETRKTHSGVNEGYALRYICCYVSKHCGEPHTGRLTTDLSGLKRVRREVKNMAAQYVDTETILSS